MALTATATALKNASEWLTYQSETDSPWTVFSWPDQTGEPDAERVRQKGRHRPTAPLREESIEAFFTPLIEEQDWYRPSLLTLSSAEILDSLTEEVFGPVQIVMRYASASELLSVLSFLPGSLTTTMHVEPADQDLASAVMDTMRDKAGRYVFNGYPTGVSVAWAQHHGGPWPATNSIHTSVGASSIRRFLRPVAYQSAPEWILPPELRDDAITLPRRVDGVLYGSARYPSGEPGS